MTHSNPLPGEGLPGHVLSATASAATAPASKGVGGFLAMSEAREAELLRQIPTIRSTEELDGFRAQLAAQGETPTAGLYQALMRQSERLK